MRGPHEFGIGEFQRHLLPEVGGEALGQRGQRPGVLGAPVPDEFTQAVDAPEDFASILRRQGLLTPSVPPGSVATHAPPQTHATTILAFKYADGVLVERLQGERELVMTPSASGKGQQIARCPQCRIALWSHYAGAGPSFAFVRVGTLDEPDRFPPDIHIFTMSKQPWVVLPEGVPAMPEYYDREKYWPADSLARRAAVLSGAAPG